MCQGAAHGRVALAWPLPGVGTLPRRRRHCLLTPLLCTTTFAASPRAGRNHALSTAAAMPADTTLDSPSLSRPLVVRALYDFASAHPTGLGFEAGALIHVLSRLESGWWDGLLDPHLLGPSLRGWFPSNYVQPITQQDCDADPHVAAEVAAVLAASSASADAGVDQTYQSPSAHNSSASSDLSDFFSQDTAHPIDMNAHDSPERTQTRLNSPSLSIHADGAISVRFDQTIP